MSETTTNFSPSKLELFALLLKKRGLQRELPDAIQKQNAAGACRLSFAQERIWTFEQLEPGTSAYNIPMGVRLEGRLNIPALERSINEIVRRHEALRVTFKDVDGKPVQSVSTFAPQRLPVFDLSELPATRREIEALHLSVEEGRKPFNLNEDLLLRALLLRLSDDVHTLLLTLHHISADGVSLQVLTRELTALYEAFSTGKPSPFTDLPIQYSDYACWQREWLQGDLLEQQLSYWTRQLQDAPVTLSLPTDRPRPAKQTFRGAKQTSPCSKSLTQALREFSHRQGSTLFMTLLAAYSVLLYRYSWQEDILIGTPVANRTRVETENLIGFFVNTLVVRARLSGTQTFAELLQGVRETSLAAFAHQDLPFEKLVNALHLKRDSSRHPLFQAFFVFFDSPLQATELSNLRVIPINTYNGLSKFDIELAIMESEKELQFIVLHNTDLFDAKTITNFLSDYERLLEEVVAKPDLRLLDIPLRANTATVPVFTNADSFTFV
jgi:aspartate racemase